MRRILGIGLIGIVASVGALRAQTPPPTEPEVFSLGQIDFGIESVDVDTDSSKFYEYRDLPNGFVVPFFRLFGEQKVRFDVWAVDVGQEDARYHVELEKGAFRLEADLNKIVHNLGNDGHTLLEDVAPGVLAMSDTLQAAHQAAIATRFAASPASVNFAFLSQLVAPSLAAARSVDLAVQRDRGNLALSLTPGQPVDVKVTYFQENRTGSRPAGTSFGFSNVVETPEPIDYRTQDIGATAEYAQPWGLVRGAVHYNRFENRIDTLTFDNPFRATDSTSANAYQSPGSSSIDGPSRGRVDLAPNNEALTGSLGFAWRLPANSRFTADVSVSEWKQDDQFIPYTINTAIVSPLDADNPATLPRQNLDGRINVLSQSYAFVSRPLPKLGVTARLRSYELENDTARISFPGYVRFDAVWEDIPRISVPYGYQRDQADIAVSYDLGPATVEGGYRYVRWDRTFRETEETTEDVLLGSVDLRLFGWAQLRATYETGERDRDAYDAEHGEHASFVEPGPQVNLPALRRFDQAKRDLDRFHGLLQIVPGGDLTVSLSYLRAEEDYEAEPVVDASGLRYGLLQVESESFTAEADYAPSDRWNVYAFYTSEDMATFQRGRQSGATPSTNPLDDWTSDVEDQVDTYGAGGAIALIPERLDFTAFYRFQKVDGRNGLNSPPGGTPNVAFPIEDFDDTQLWSLSLELAYRLGASWSLALGGWHEEFDTSDSATTGLPNYVPGSFFLAANDGPYNGNVNYLKATYRW